VVRLAIVHSGWPVGSAFRVTPGRVDELALGALLAVLLRDPAWRPRLRAAWAPAAIAGGALFLAVGAACDGFDMHHPVLEVWSHTLLGIAFAGVVAGAVSTERTRHPLQRVLGAGPLQQLGRLSYGVYVIHYFVHEAALHALRADPRGAALLATRAGYAAYAVAGTAASLALAWASWHLFETRFLALKSRFAPGPREAAAVTPGRRSDRSAS
jgi:peptidoglycan/LPS O-acetylase OafA/YrhL